MRLIHLTFCFFTVLLVTSCDEGATSFAIPEDPNEQLAWAMASALADDDVREHVHTAMDESPYVEHKLVLGDFLETEDGAALKAELETQLGSADKLDRVLGELPEMDFYLPYETHRETWEHANEKLMVVCVLHPDATEATAYTSDKSTKLLDTPEKVYEARQWALFSLHPAEYKFQKADREKSVQQPTAESGIYMVEVVNYITDGLFGGASEFYFRTSVDFENYQASEVFHVLPGRRDGGWFHDDIHPANKVFENGFQITQYPLPLTPETDYEAINIELIELDEFSPQVGDNPYPLDSIVITEDQNNISAEGEINFGGSVSNPDVIVTIQER